MVDVLHFYMDDSGTRQPDHAPGKRAAHGYDWFSLGGILVKQEDEEAARKHHAEFCAKWEIKDPLHSSEIRSPTGPFAWVGTLPKEEKEAFYEELYQLLSKAPVVGLACVIDRPGYNKRYAELYRDKRWQLCKTAFTVSVERAAKYAPEMGYKLKVFPERCNKREDGVLRSYYEEMRTNGMPFNEENSGKYAPLTSQDLKAVLYGFMPKKPSSPMIQLADLYLWPICMGGYNAANRPYKRLIEDRKLIECHLDEADWPMLATKYSCFDLIERRHEQQKGPETPGLDVGHHTATS